MDHSFRLVPDPGRPIGDASTATVVATRRRRRRPPRRPVTARRILGAVGSILASLGRALADDAADRAEVWGEGLTGTPAPRARPGRRRP